MDKNIKNVIKKMNIRKIIILITFLIMYGVIIMFINKNKPINSDADVKTTYEVAKVVEVISDNTTVDKKNDNIKKGSMELKIKILSGTYKGKEYTITNYMSAMYNIDVDKGDKISVRIDLRNDGKLDIAVYNYYRVGTVLLVMGMFALILVLIGGKKGFKALIGLVFTLVNIVYILLPLTLKGFSPVGVTFGVVLISTIVSFILLDGLSKKSIIATIGTLCGIAIGTLFALVAAKIMCVTTYQMEEAESLLLAMTTTKLHARNLLLCGIIISCMGAVMDVAMSISSAIEELVKVNDKLSIKDLYKSGMNIGRDAMGTMANTLVLAFAGNSLNMLVLIYSYGVSFTQLINTDFIAIEIIKAISGSIGIIVSVPVVAIVASYMVKNVKIKVRC